MRAVSASLRLSFPMEMAMAVQSADPMPFFSAYESQRIVRDDIPDKNWAGSIEELNRDVVAP